jgi:hypothetical protein
MGTAITANLLAVIDSKFTSLLQKIEKSNSILICTSGALLKSLKCLRISSQVQSTKIAQSTLDYRLNRALR